jgi:hypothetical protein
LCEKYDLEQSYHYINGLEGVSEHTHDRYLRAVSGKRSFGSVHCEHASSVSDICDILGISIRLLASREEFMYMCKIPAISASSAIYATR